MQPLFGAEKIWELEDDYSYLKYLYPDICSQINKQIEEECDRLEYDGSIMFDDYPDKMSLQRLAGRILENCQKEDPNCSPDQKPNIGELVEILLYQEILFRRARYRKRKRLYF